MDCYRAEKEGEDLRLPYLQGWLMCFSGKLGLQVPGEFLVEMGAGITKRVRRNVVGKKSS